MLGGHNKDTSGTHLSTFFKMYLFNFFVKIIIISSYVSVKALLFERLCLCRRLPTYICKSLSTPDLNIGHPAYTTIILINVIICGPTINVQDVKNKIRLACNDLGEE